VASDVIKNSLLKKVAKADPDGYARLSGQLEPTSLHHRWSEIGRSGRSAPSVYFPETATLSVVAATSQGDSVQVATIGYEGVAGMPLGPATASAEKAILIQIPGLAYRVPLDVAKAHAAACPAFQQALMAYTETLIGQLTQAAVCNRFHNAVQRLARWLVVTTERAETDRLTLTHELLAQMLGAPRSAVTQAAAVLKRQGNISIERGMFVVRNRQRLRRVACDCVDTFLPPRPAGHAAKTGTVRPRR
jgi:CRP-like cAMP-binding protein